MRSSQPSTKAYKAKEATRELVERPPPPVVVPAAPAPAVAAPPRKEVNIPAFVQFILVGATIISAVYLAAVYNPTSFRIHPPRTSRQSCDKGSWSLENLKTTPVKRYQWEASLPFAAQLAAWREPVILTGTSVTQWKAIKRWASDEYLRSRPELATMNETMVVRQCQMNPSASTNPLAAAGLIHAPENFYSINATADLFFTRFNNPEEDQYWYWYGKVTGSLVDDVSPSDHLWVEPLDEEQFGLFMWLSGPDIGPWWHYDQDHNFYVQVSGTKRFVLIPPWETSKMYPYPQIHPRNHKSQINFDKPDLQRMPKYAEIQDALVAELVPGEVMYIPPYWWHHVRSHVRSVSLASWSQSGVFRVMRYGLYKRQFTFDKYALKSPIRLAALRHLLLTTAKLLYGAGSPFFENLVQTRWNPFAREEIEKNLPIEAKLEDVSDVHRRLCFSATASKIGSNSNLVEKTHDDDPSSTMLDDDTIENIVIDAKAAIQAFENCQTKSGAGNTGIGKERRDMKAIRDIEFADFTEFLLASELGAEDVLPFLDHCLNTKDFESETNAA